MLLVYLFCFVSIWCNLFFGECVNGNDAIAIWFSGCTETELLMRSCSISSFTLTVSRFSWFLQALQDRHLMCLYDISVSVFSVLLNCFIWWFMERLTLDFVFLMFFFTNISFHVSAFEPQYGYIYVYMIPNFKQLQLIR